MKKKKKVGSAGRMGARYGWKLRGQVRDVERRARAKHECSECGKTALERVGTGIWRCSRCGSVFAGGAFVPKTAESVRGE